MSKYLHPLWVFAGGQILILVLFLFFPTIANAVAGLWTKTSTAPFWGWNWVVNSVRWLIVIISELLVLYNTARAFMDSGNG